MKNWNRILFLVIFSVCIISCSNDNNELSIPDSDVTVHLLPGLTTYHLIQGGEKPYSIISDDESIVTGGIDNNSAEKNRIIIKGKNLGIGKLIVKDKNDTKTTITVNVGRGAGVIMVKVTGYKFNVETSDISIKETIEQELQNTIPVSVNAIYSLIFEDQVSGSTRLLVSPSGNHVRPEYSGYYEFNDDLYTFYYKGVKQYQYTYSMVGSTNNFTLSEDLTKIYQEKYPNADIKNVYRMQEVQRIAYYG